MGQAVESYWNKRPGGPDGARSIQALRVRSRRVPSVIVVMLAVMLIVGCLSCYHQTRSELNAALAEKQAEATRVNYLQIETQRVQAEIERLKTDPKAIEALARERLGFIRPGEVVIRIQPDQTSPENSLADADTARQQQAGASVTDRNSVQPNPDTFARRVARTGPPHHPGTAGDRPRHATPLASQLGTTGYQH